MEQENHEPDPQGETRLEKVLKEKFGAAGLGNLMDSIVGKMMDQMKDAKDESDEEDQTEPPPTSDNSID